MNMIKKLNYSLLALCCVMPTLALATDKPNIVIIMADDLGPGDVSYFHRQYTDNPVMAATPTIDSLAEAGMSFTDAHSPTALCAPTRYAVMSGNSTYRGYNQWGVWSTFAKTAVTDADATIGRVGQKAGYVTGFIGKWHMGGTFYDKKGKIYDGPKGGPKTMNVDVTKWIAGNPAEFGFDYDYTIPTGVQGPMYLAYENSVWAPINKGSKIVYVDEKSALDPSFVSSKGPGVGDSHWDSRTLNMLLADKATDFIKRNAGKKPFVLNYWSPAVHVPHTPPKEINGVKIAGTTPSNHTDMNRVLDIEVDRIVQTLKDTGQYQNTLIIFTSDNGGLGDREALKAGHDSSAQWSGQKNSPLEGGHRVPFIAVWPGKIKPGTTNDTMVNGTDIVATIASLLDVKLTKEQAKDSWNLLPALVGKPYQERKLIMQQAGSKSELMLREGDWKVIIQSNRNLTKRDVIALYNLKDDPTEKNNLAHSEKHKARAQAMAKKYWQIRESGQRTAPVL
ncbi:arylsulfatase [Paraglaciecola sp. L3A3]|uniref:sulfatase family protein n=1 Tax=Paraglaciecola sp. L3A3 TaxID=2686358 RepID=UPI0018EF1292|nr:arylsulfatase [Paraglaciecola sp. L3A3]